MRKLFFRSTLLILIFLICQPATAWIFPEHRLITFLAIQKLSSEKRIALNKLWFEARKGNSERLTESIIDPSQGLEPTQIDFATWAGIAGDHSCSPLDMMEIILNSDWILNVASISAKLEVKINESRNLSERINSLRDSDIRFQRADEEYALRASSNNVHFLLARREVDMDVEEYLRDCLSKGEPMNALGAYSWFHMSAMNKAARYASEKLSDQEKSQLILAAFADEAFAIHFLEDSYASGHVAGTWGPSAVRKGTHDYYNEKGLEVQTWDGKRFISLGDAFMRQEDVEFAAESIKLSIEQLIMAATGEWELDYKTDVLSSYNTPDTLNVCTNFLIPQRVNKTELVARSKKDWNDYLPKVLMKTPVPGLAEGLGEIPRYRTEMGVFYGVSSSLNAGWVHGGFGENQNSSGASGGLEINLRLGLGLDGVLNRSGDGLIFIQGGFRQDASTSNKFSENVGTIPQGSVPSAIPSRSAYAFRLRLPFWLIPGDMLVLAPILALTSPKTLTKMAVTSANGGLIPWQSGIATPVGRFQFVLGREIGVSIYGAKETGILIPTPDGIVYMSYSSTKLDFPVLEYNPFHTFSKNQSSSMNIQFTVGVDLPRNTSVILPEGEQAPNLIPVWNVGMRMIFDWRRYF
ncbi:hypothetical protein JYB62_04430 [Algoriphagus lutimaris]|uniref:hypothetical protein n=1 Tax=Algoriphagus lutimaris TaxID=613197 RepID=UPI00196AD78A|nr:hypothetical protein [Algoriphagus lutimaris]MBN3519240.1 hypothetical protein [Algoriphagus lutimaris]